LVPAECDRSLSLAESSHASYPMAYAGMTYFDRPVPPCQEPDPCLSSEWLYVPSPSGRLLRVWSGDGTQLPSTLV
jgi:hypothetical protein